MMGSTGRSMEGMFDQVDRNKDGVIPREEWNAMHSVTATPGSRGGVCCALPESRPLLKKRPK